MEVARRLAMEGSREGTSVTADRQTCGRGRLGRSWLSEPGLGLYLSVVLRPDCGGEELPILPLVAGVAVREALAGLTGADCDLRWPNDILIKDRKCCGILAEKGPALDRVDFVVLGIGVNLNHLEFPAGLRTEATSLRIETGREWSGDAVRDSILASLAARCEQHRRSGREAVIRAFHESSSYAAGRSVVVEGPERGGLPRRGVTAGLNAGGQLLIRSPDGTVRPLVSGSVRPDGATM